MSESQEAQTGEVGTLSQIWIYPVKACRRVALDAVEVTQAGLVGDRMWQIVDENLNAVTQRTDKKLALVHVQINSDGGITLSYEPGPNETGPGETGPGETGASVTVPPVSEAADDFIVNSLVGDQVRCADAGAEAAEFFSEVLGRPARLAGFTNTTKRPSIFPKGHYVSFADATPLTIANTASLANLEELAKTTFGMERFRPNLVVDTDMAWAEDCWDRFSVGPAALVSQLAWPRCPVPQIDQDTATRTQEPAVVLKKYRWCTDAATMYPNRPGVVAMLENNAVFAISCTLDLGQASSSETSSSEAGPGQTGPLHLALGDKITVESVKPPLLTPPLSTDSQ